ncbi:MAG: HAD family phosphatase [Blautia sp.]|nr:HAD family phosphatase [Blautia sp.]
MNKKIIFLDIDGTIRNFDGTIPDSTVSAIQKAREHGHKVCISTGRPLFQVSREVLNIGFDGVISDSGGYVVYEGECVRNACYDPKLYTELCGDLLRKGCIVELQRHDRGFVPVEVQKQYQLVIQGMIATMGEGADDFVKNLPGYEPDWKSVTGIEKILYFCSKEVYEQIRQEWGEKVHVTSFSIPNTAVYGGEISPMNIKKKEGMISILEKAGFSREDTIAIGDSDNDIDMLEFAAVGVAMGSGTVNAKAAADFVTDPLMQDGLAHAFEKLGL